jgi:hypothetical protein
MLMSLATFENEAEPGEEEQKQTRSAWTAVIGKLLKRADKTLPHSGAKSD